MIFFAILENRKILPASGSDSLYGFIFKKEKELPQL